MPAKDSKRLQIINAIETRLLEITVANGFDHDLTAKQVSKKYFLPNTQNTADFPVCLIVPGQAPYAPQANGKYSNTTDPFGVGGWSIGVLVYVHAKTDLDNEGLITEALELLIYDVTKKMLEDRQINGLSFVHNIYLRSIHPGVNVEENIGYAEIVFQVKYAFDKANP